MNRRRFLLGSIAGAGLGVAAYSRFVERHDIETTSLTIDRGFPHPLRALILGDIHFDPLYEVDYLHDVIDRTNRLAADIVLYTGDFLSHTTDRLDELVAILRTLRGPSFAVLGNHDHDVGADTVSAALASSGIVLLRNQSVPLPGASGWFLTGLESFWCGAPDLDVLSRTPSGSQHLLLVHEPDSFDLATNPNVGLQVSGHTHGGQVRVPLIGPLALPTWGKKYPAGLYERGERALYVNRGIGTVDHHVRLNCRPEITVLNLM